MDDGRQRTGHRRVLGRASGREKTRANDITDLVFINWARLDPQASHRGGRRAPPTNITRGGHGPATIRRARSPRRIAANPDRVNNVAWGLGEFQAEWLLRALRSRSRKPRAATRSRGLTKWDDTDQPLEMLEFLKKTRQLVQPRHLRHPDPQGPVGRLRLDAGKRIHHHQLLRQQGERDEAAGRNHGAIPTGRLAAPRGPDPVRRAQAARWKPRCSRTCSRPIRTPRSNRRTSTKAPVIAAERLAAVGMSLVKTDPDKAFEIAKDLFATNPSALTVRTVIQSPNGSTSWGGSGNEGVMELVNALMAKDPAKVMTLQPPPGDGSPGPSSDFQTSPRCGRNRISWRIRTG